MRFLSRTVCLPLQEFPSHLPVLSYNLLDEVWSDRITYLGSVPLKIPVIFKKRWIVGKNGLMSKKTHWNSFIFFY